MATRTLNLLSITVLLCLLLALVSTVPVRGSRHAQPPEHLSPTRRSPPPAELPRDEISEPSGSHPDAETRARMETALDELPLHFIDNHGQHDGRVVYYAQQGGSSLYFTEDELVIALPAGVLRQRFAGAEPNVQITGADAQPAKFNHLSGDSTEGSHINIASYGKVAYPALYPGVDLIYTGRNGVLEYRFVVEPGADVQAIRFVYAGADELHLAENGDLLITPEGAERPLRAAVPTVYQEIDGAQLVVDAAFTLHRDSTYSLAMSHYDSDRSLMIESQLHYSTSLGGSDWDSALAIALDSTGNVYVAGSTHSSDFPTIAGAYDQTYNDNRDAFVSILDPALSTLRYSTFLGGSRSDQVDAIALDGAGNVYVTGVAVSDNFPTTPGAHDEMHNGSLDAFVSILNPTLSTLRYSTFLGGSDSDWASAGIALDSARNVCVTGLTSSSDFPTTPGAYDEIHNGSVDAFVSILDPTLSTLRYSTFLGGSHSDSVYDVTLNIAGRVFVTGQTRSSDFPTTSGAYDETFNGEGKDDSDAFVSMLDPTLSTLRYSTFLGGSNMDWPSGIALDAEGNVYVTGLARSDNFPTTSGAYDETFNGEGKDDSDAFVSMLDPTLSTLHYSTFLGGSNQDQVYAITLDGTGNVYVTGLARSDNFPTTSGAYDETFNGSLDAFVSVLNWTPGKVTVTKVVDWSSVTPDQAQEFVITLTGPSHPKGDSKTVGYEGGTLNWTDLKPGTYTVSEVAPGEAWSVTGSGVEILVVEGTSATATITNTFDANRIYLPLVVRGPQ